MPKVDRLNNVVATLKKLRAKWDHDEKVVQTGYSQNYAIYVHENQGATHKEGKQSKYLESPARRYRKEISDVIRRTYIQTKSIEKALIVGGLRLQRESQLIVPIDTGALKASAYTSVESKAQAAAQMSFAKSEAIRIKEEGRREARSRKAAIRKEAKRTKSLSDKSAVSKTRRKK